MKSSYIDNPVTAMVGAILTHGSGRRARRQELSNVQRLLAPSTARALLSLANVEPTP